MRKMTYEELLQFCKNVLKCNEPLIKGYYDMHQLSKIYGSSVEYKGNFNIFLAIFKSCNISNDDIMNILDNLSLDLAYAYCCEYQNNRYPYSSREYALYYYILCHKLSYSLLSNIKFNNTESLYRQFFNKNFKKVINDEDYLYDLLFQKIVCMIRGKLNFCYSIKEGYISKRPIVNLKQSTFTFSSLLCLLHNYKFSQEVINNAINKFFDVFSSNFYLSSAEQDIVSTEIAQELIALKPTLNNINEENIINNAMILNQDNLIDLLVPYIDDIYDRYGKKFFKKCTRGYNLYIMYYIYFQKYFNDEMFNILISRLHSMARNDSYNFKSVNHYINSGCCNIPDIYLNKFNALKLITELKK